MGEASELLHSRLGIEDPELVILNVNLKSREGCTESVRFDKCTHGPSLPANKREVITLKIHQGQSRLFYKRLFENYLL